MSKAAKRRAHKETRRLKPTPPRAVATTAAPLRVVGGSEARLRAKTGIEWLVAKKRLTARQARAGARYGLKFRLAEVEGMQPLRSCLNDEPRGGEGAMTVLRVTASADAKRDLAVARAALSFHAEMIAACDLICGRSLTPWEAIEITGGTRKEVERLEHTLAIALDLLAKHFDEFVA